MVRDLDLIRKVLLAIEASPSGYAPHPLVVEGYEQEIVDYNVLLMMEGGLITGNETTTMSGSPSAIAGRLTWDGHEFLESAKQPTTWEHGKALASRAGSSSFKVIVEALTKAAFEAMK